MRILVVAESTPTTGARGGDGHALIVARILPRLAERAEVHLRYFSTPGATPEIPRLASVEHLPYRPALARAVAPFAIWRLPSTFVRDGRSARRMVAAAGGSADVALFHGPKVVPLARAAGCPTVVQHVDAWSNQLRHRIEARSGMHRMLWPHVLLARRAERHTGAAVDLTVSPADARVLSRTLGRSVLAVPNGVARVDGSVPFERRCSLLFVGSLDYWPNVAAVTRLRERIFPLLRERDPGLGVRVVGRNPVPEVLALATEGFEIVPDAADLAPEFAQALLAVFPDTSGSGTRNAVSEAVCAGLPVVASAHAARNQPPGPHLRLAGSDAEFAAHIAELGERAAWERAHTAALDACSGYPTWDAVADRYLEILRGVARTGAHGTISPHTV